MGASRTYGDPCGVARSFDVVGERWALLIVRELLLGPKRFSDLLDGLAGASPNIVSQRLRELIQSGVVHRRALGPPHTNPSLRTHTVGLPARASHPPPGALGRPSTYASAWHPWDRLARA